jgi:hypothetical protein
MCVLVLLYVCPHATIYVSSFYYICVLILLGMCLHSTIYTGGADAARGGAASRAPAGMYL